MSNDTILEIDKYTYILTPEGKQLINRNGKPWRDETGDGFLCLMASHLEAAWEELALAQEIIEDSGLDFEEMMEIKRGGNL